MNLDPQPGDTWTLAYHPTLEVVSIKSGDVYYSYGGTPMREPLDRFTEMAERSIARGAVLRRGREVMSKETEGFEI